MKRKKKQEANCPLTAPPGLVPTKPRAEALAISDEELQVVQETLDTTKDLVPADSPEIPRISPPQQVLSPLSTLPLTPEPNLLIAPKDMPENIMEQDEAVPERQADVEDVEMTEMGPTAQAAAAAAPAAGAAAASPAIPQ